MVLRAAAIVEQSWHRVPGGTATTTVRVLEALHARDDVDVVGVAARHRDPPPLDVRPRLPVKHLALPRPILYESWHRFGRPSVQGVTGPVDVVHATGGVVPPSGSAALVVTIHDLAFLHRPGHFTKQGVRFMTRGFELARRRADVVVCPSRATAADCEARGVAGERLRIVPWGVTPVELTPTEVERVRVAHRLPEDFVLWVGTAEPRKNLRGLLAAMDRVEVDAPLVLVGPDGWQTDVAALIAGTEHQVVRLGPVPRSELEALYAAARVFAYPSLLEGFGMPVLEAMAAGAPVVTSAGTATEEVCGDAGRVVDPDDLDGLAAAITELLVDDTIHAELSLAGRLRADSFTWEAAAAATLEAYEDALR